MLKHSLIVLIGLFMVPICIDSIPNGCGSGNFIINNGLKEVGEGSLIECCNGHDNCYGQCNGRTFCDKQFKICLVNTCDRLPFIRKQLCLMDVDGMYMAVRLLGQNYYCTSTIWNRGHNTTIITPENELNDDNINDGSYVLL